MIQACSTRRHAMVCIPWALDSSLTPCIGSGNHLSWLLFQMPEDLVYWDNNNSPLFSNLSPPGVLTALTQPTPAALRKAIRETRKNTLKPFGVNITLLPSINPPDYEGYARAAVEEGVRVFETAGNNRMCVHVIVTLIDILLAGHLIKYFKSQGCIVIHKCTSIRHAKVSPN